MRTMHLVRVLNHDLLSPRPSDFHYNLALEEIILLHHEHDAKFVGTIRFWKNPPSVVLGRHQILEEEVNIEYCQQQGIQVGRRISGGGTVYHDEGNLNMSFFFPKAFLPTKKDLLAITRFFTDLIIRSLQQAGLTNLERESHSNIFYKNKKISGAASYQRKEWILHHATLLLDANLEKLEKSLLARSSNPSDKRRSRYFPTTNLNQLNLHDWKNVLLNEMSNTMNVKCVAGQLTAQEITDAKLLAQYMYDTKEWTWHRKRILLSTLKQKIMKKEKAPTPS